MPKIDVLAIGNAIVDISTRTEDNFIRDNGIIKGAMNLIDARRADLLYSRMETAMKASGGSAANTAAGVANLGGTAAFLGKVASDPLGEVFTRDLRAQRVLYDTRPLKGAIPTARSMIFITPDGERSMNTYLGACSEFGPEDIDVSRVAQASVTYFEGYLWDPPRAKEAILLAIHTAHKNGNKVAMTLSDPFCVNRYRDEFLHLIRNKNVDIVFANEAELTSLYETDCLDSALRAIRADCSHIACITRSEKGSILVRREETCAIAAFPVDQPVDTTGAGDLYAAGFLYGYAHKLPLQDAARLGSLAGSLVIRQFGPRITSSLRTAAIGKGLIETG